MSDHVEKSTGGRGAEGTKVSERKFGAILGKQQNLKDFWVSNAVTMSNAVDASE
jgi:hypothetical protein